MFHTQASTESATRHCDSASYAGSIEAAMSVALLSRIFIGSPIAEERIATAVFALYCKSLSRHDPSPILLSECVSSVVVTHVCLLPSHAFSHALQRRRGQSWSQETITNTSLPLVIFAYQNSDDFNCFDFREQEIINMLVQDEKATDVKCRSYEEHKSSFLLLTFCCVPCFDEPIH